MAERKGFEPLKAVTPYTLSKRAQSTTLPSLRYLAVRWRQPTQPHLGARIHCYRCSLPGLAEFTIYRREGTKVGHHSGAYASRITLGLRTGSIARPRLIAFLRTRQ